MEYPDKCIKGIPNNSFVRDGLIGSDLFYFKDRDARDDEWIEQSINWHDDEQAVQFTLNQTKEEIGELHFKAGIALLPRAEIDRIREKCALLDRLSYERYPLEYNPYHGNILLHVSILKSPRMKQIAATLALHAQYIPRTAQDPNIVG